MVVFLEGRRGADDRFGRRFVASGIKTGLGDGFV
jgi:hypothetical protein